MKERISQERLKELLHYDPETGIFTRLIAGKEIRLAAGTRAGCLKKHGYRTCDLDGRRYYEHHLAWFYVTGEWLDRIDHENGVGTENRFSNLRPCTQQQNLRNKRRQDNNKCGFKGVVFDADRNRWRASISINGVQTHLGRFKTAEEAHAAYVVAAQTHFGEFARAA